MKEYINELINELDYHNKFTTEQAIICTVLGVTTFILAAFGESIILSLF